MKYPTDIQKIEREKRIKKRQELWEIASPLHQKRRKPIVNPKFPIVSRNGRIEIKSGRLTEFIKVPTNLTES